MDRVIKFRAWDKVDCKMRKVTGWNIPASGIRSTVSMLSGQIRNIRNVDLMQFTGLTDKNGVEIFEGDIVALYKSVGVITFEWGCFVAKITKAGNPGDREGLNYPMSLDGEKPLLFKIIGNIFENPELIKAA